MKVPTTEGLERVGAVLLSDGLPDSRIEEFVRRVCRWGGYPGIAGRVLKHNTLAQIRSAFLEAVGQLALGQPRVATALSAVNRISGLGRPSFASKHLRFLRPDLCPVLDRLVAKHCGYPLDPSGYHAFAAACRTASHELITAHVANPVFRPGGVWFVADVENALFAEINGWVA